MNKTSGLDFGTTNSCIGVNDGKNITMISLNGDDKITTKTAIVYDIEDKKFYIGDKAVHGIVAGDIVGRLVRSPKSFLSDKNEPTTFLGGRRMSLTEIISMIVKEFREQTSSVINEDIDAILVGRPVYFDENDCNNDANAQQKLFNAVRQAGYKDILFMKEPVAAAISIIDKIPHDKKEKVIMVADLGGGTSDFSLVRVSSDRKTYEVLGSNGFYKGGDYLDQQFSLHSFASYLGKDLTFTPEASSESELNVPSSVFSLIGDRKMVGRAEKHQINSLKQIKRLVSEPETISRVIEILEESDSGHLYLDMIEGNKIRLSNDMTLSSKTSFLTNDFSYEITRSDFEKTAGGFIDTLNTSLDEFEKLCGVPLSFVDHVFISGGTGLIPIIKGNILSRTGIDKEFLGGDNFSAIGEGLTIASYDLFNNQ